MFPFPPPPPLLLFLVLPRAKGNPGCALLPGCHGGEIMLAPLLFFSGFSFCSSDTQRSVYTPLFGSISGYLIYKKSCTHSFGSRPFILALFFFFFLLHSDLSIFSPWLPSLPLLHSLWFSLCLFSILLLLFWCVSRSVIQRIRGGGVDASESHLSPWHRRAQSQREGWDFPLYSDLLSAVFYSKCVHTCKCSKTHHGQLMALI